MNSAISIKSQLNSNRDDVTQLEQKLNESYKSLIKASSQRRQCEAKVIAARQALSDRQYQQKCLNEGM